MLAKLHLLLPFTIIIPEGELFPSHPYVEDGYEIRIYPPVRSDQPTTGTTLENLRVNGVEAFVANALRVDFKKDVFERRSGTELDPPSLLIQKTINSFLSKLRFVTGGFQIKPVNFPRLTWHLRYLNDDETELEKVEGLVRGRFSKDFSLSWITLNKQVWEDVHALPLDYIPPEWNTLFLDAITINPEVSPSIVLASTSLEVFISQILNKLAHNKVKPEGMWEWINKRDWWLKEPSPDEQFDALLKLLLGSSLKEDNDLWEVYKNLKDARNTFVHEGVAKVGNRTLTDDEAKKLVGQVPNIFKFVRD